MGAYPGFLVVGLCLLLLSGGGEWNTVVEARPIDPPDMSAINSNIDRLFNGLECSPLAAMNVKQCVAGLVGSTNYWNICSVVKDARNCYTNGFEACKLDPRLKDDFLQGYDKGISNSDECSSSSSFTLGSSPYSVPLIILGIILILTSLTKLTVSCCNRSNRTSAGAEEGDSDTANLIK